MCPPRQIKLPHRAEVQVGIPCVLQLHLHLADNKRRGAHQSQDNRAILRDPRRPQVGDGRATLRHFDVG